MAEAAPKAPQQDKPAAAPSAPETPKEKTWSDYVAISTAIIAVVAAVTASQAGGKSSRNIILQSQESDQWAYYQAKSIKGHTYQLQSELVGLLPAEAALAPAREQLRSRYAAEAARYEKEREDIKAKAESLAVERKDVAEHGGRFGKALIALQISIVLSSVSGLTKKKWLWLFSLALGGLGVGGFGWAFFF